MKHSWKRIFALILAVVMTLSLLPTAALAAKSKSAGRAGGVTIDVTDYGADPTGAKESSTAVIAALEYAKTLGEDEQKTIVFPKGEYHFYADYSEKRELYVSNTLQWHERSYAEKSIGILVEGMKNVTIDGGGSLFIYHGNICTMAAIGSENVTFTNFSEDHASPDVIDVTVEAHEGEKTALLYVPPCYTYTISGTTINWKGELGPVTGTPYFTGSNNMGKQQFLNTITGQVLNNDGGKLPFSNVSSIEVVDGDPTHLRVTYNNASNRPTVGMCFQMRNPNPRMTPGTFFLDSDGVTVSNASFHFLHGFGMVSQLSKNITLDTVTFGARPGTGRTSAGFADFVQMSSVGGKVTIRNCDFFDPHDDPINIHGTFLEVTDITADRRRVVVKYQHSETWGFPQYNVGDTVDFSVKGTLAPSGVTRQVVGVVNPGEGLNLNGTQRSKDNENDMRTIIVELDEALPASISANHDVMENVTYIPEVLIENCRFREVPTRGILVTSRKKVEILNNYFDRMKSSSIFISCDANLWRESGHSEDVLISGNTFIGQNTTGDSDLYGGSAIIMIWPTNDNDDPNYQIHRNIRIENNKFNLLEMPGNKRAIVAKSVNGLTVQNNLFQRYTPNVELALTADSTALTAGGTQSTALTSNGTALTNRLFRLQACKQVVFEGNTYDDGLNLGVQLDGNVVTAADVTDNDGVLTVGGDNQLPAVGAVRYFSSDPAVATVDESGVVTGVSAGTAEIYAYRVAGARTFESNHLTFTVTGTAAATVNKIEITGDSTVDVGGNVTLTATVDPSDAGSVAWSVKPASEGAAATITSGGVLTATAPGVVEVTASLGGVTGSKLITVNKPSFVYLSDLDWTSATTGDSWSSVPLKDLSWESEKDGRDVQPIKVTGPNGEAVTFEKGIGTHADSTITYDLAGLGYTRFTGKVGVSYYKHDSDEPHLYFVINGDGTQKFASSEMRGSTPYQEVDVDITGVNTLELKLTQPGNAWSAHGNWADAKLLCENTAPTASGVAATANDTDGTVTVGYTYSDADDDAETGSLIAWYVSDSETGHYTRVENASSTTLTVTAATSGKWVKAVVVPKDAMGRYGAPVASAAVQAPAQPVVQDDATLATLSVSGLPLSPAFDPAVTKYAVSVPASATKVTIAATATQGESADVLGTGAVSLSGPETTVTIMVTAPDHTTTKTYTVTVNRAASSDATLSNLTASAGSAAITYNAATRFYELVATQGTQSLTFSATKADPNATIAVRYNAEEKGAYEDAPKTLPLTAGLNNLELRVTAADGISTALYRVRVMKPASAEAELTALTVNGESVTIGDETDLGLVPVTGNTATLNATVSEGATVYLSVDGKAAENNASVTLAKTLSMATVRVVAEDGTTENVYTLALSKNDPGNADLYLLKLEGMTLSPAFDKDTLTYTATFTDAQGTSALTAAATQAGADVTCETVSIYETAKGRVARDCHFFRDVEENFVKITVTSPNGETTKEYIINVAYEPVVYLSDLQWTSHTSGWSDGWPNPGVDIGVENNPMSLWNGSDWETFEKGLGTHANSNTTFNISGRGFTRFTAKVGPNKNSGSPHISFAVELDGVTRWSSVGEITHSDPYQTIDIDVTGVNTLKIIDNQTGGNGSAHATWADAKFYGDGIGPALAETEVFVKHIEFEHEEHTIYVNGTADDTDHPSSMELHPVIKPIGVEDSARTLVLDWDSSEDTVATVTDGRVTAYGVGETTITATAVDKTVTGTCAITVKKLVEGTLSVSGDLRYNTQLTVRDNELEEDVKGNVTYTWYRGSEASGTALGTGKTYTPVAADIGQALTVKAAAKEGGYYEGEVTFTTAVIGLEAGHEVNEANLTYTNCTNETSADGEIQGLLEGHVYQYQKQNDDETWPEEWNDVAGDAITGLAPGNYRIRHAGDDTREPGEPSNTITISVVGTTEVALTVPQRFEGGVVRANRAQIPVGDTVTLTVTPDKGYELATLEATYTDDDGEEQTLTPTKGSDGKYTFLMPAFPVTIDATFTKSTYTIGHGLEHITCNEEDHQHTATHGETFSIILTPEEGYNMPRSLTVTETDTGKKFTDFNYDAHETDPAKRVLTFPNGVTCDITIEGEGTPKTYTVVYELTNGLTAPGAPQTATHSKELSATLTAARGYTLPQEIAVTMGGAQLTAEDYAYDAETGVVTMESVTGNVVITAQGEAEDVPLRAATLVGPARVGRTLTVNVEPTLATVECQWILVDEDGTETEIAGATGKSYVIPADAEGKTIKVRVTGKDGYTGELTTDPTDTVLAASEPFVFVTGIELSAQEIEVAVGKKVTITATVTPDNATAPALAWSSDNEAIAKVDQNGVVTGVAEGTATITAASTDTVNNVTATCQVTVTKATTPDKPSTTRPSTTTTPTTEVKEDGTKVTTETKPDGTKVETVEEPDGTKAVTETKPDGTKTATVEEPDGTKAVTETKPDGSKTATVEQPDGTKSETVVTAEGDATITVTDPEGEELAKVELPATIPEPETKFEDLAPTPWAEASINKVAGLELVKGIGGNKYDPVTPMTRGALATVLHRLSNGKTDYKAAFKDVQDNRYYTEGVAWAAKANVVKGISEDIFAPDQIITREQLAVMLARYAKLIGMNTKADTKSLDAFVDGNSTGTWAVDGVAWCVEQGILKGKGLNNLDPTADVSRAEVAVMLDRFIALIQK